MSLAPQTLGTLPGLAYHHAMSTSEALEGRARQPDSHSTVPLPPFLFFSPFSSRLSERASGPAAIITKYRPANFGCEEAPLTCRVPKAWQVAVGVSGPSKPERSDSPVQAPVPPQSSSFPCTVSFVPQCPGGLVHKGSSLDSGTLRTIIMLVIMIIVIVANTY